MEAAKERGNYDEAELIEIKIKRIMNESCSPKLLEAIEKNNLESEIKSPFEDEKFANSYFES